MDAGVHPRCGRGIRPLRRGAPRRVRTEPAGGVRQLGRLLLQPALAASHDGSSDARSVTGRDRQRVLRRSPWCAALHAAPRRRRRGPERKARRDDGVGDGRCGFPRTGCGVAHGNRARSYPPRPVGAVGFRVGGASPRTRRPRPGGRVDPVLPDRARHLARTGCRSGDLRRDRSR